MNTLQKGFTLVELVVAATIIAILSTVGFVAYTGYLDTGRNSNRIVQLNDIKEGFNTYLVNSRLPLPDKVINIQASGSTFAYQGYINKEIMETIGYMGGGKDVEFELYPTYMLGTNKQDFQLMTYVTDNSYLSSVTPKSYAAIDDYSELFPKLTGQPMGILIHSITNEPLQENSTVQTAGVYDIVTGALSLKAYYSDKKTISSTSTDLKAMIPNQSCKRLFDMGKSQGNKIYKINPTGTENIRVYCNMDSNEGGWTLLFNHEVLGGLFVDDADAIEKNIGNPKASLYSILSQIESFQRDGKYEFWIRFPELDGQAGGNIWTQTSNLTTDSIAGYEAVSIAYTTHGWGGLEPSSGSNTLIDGSVGVSAWWYAIGSRSYNGGTGTIPGANSTAVRQVQLYVK